MSWRPAWVSSASKKRPLDQQQLQQQQRQRAAAAVGCGAVRAEGAERQASAYDVVNASGAVVGGCVASVDPRGTIHYVYTWPGYLQGVRVGLPQRVACMHASGQRTLSLTNLVESDLHR